jgi:hypothetical protein
MVLETEMLTGRYGSSIMQVFGVLSTESLQKFVSVLKLNPSTATEQHLMTKLSTTRCTVVCFPYCEYGPIMKTIQYMLDLKSSQQWLYVYHMLLARSFFDTD